MILSVAYIPTMFTPWDKLAKIHPSINPGTHPSTHPSTQTHIHPSIYLFINSSTVIPLIYPYPSIHPSIHPPHHDHPLIYPPTLSTQPPNHWCIHPPTQSILLSIIHPAPTSHQSIHPSIHPSTHLLLHMWSRGAPISWEDMVRGLASQNKSSACLHSFPWYALLCLFFLDVSFSITLTL